MQQNEFYYILVYQKINEMKYIGHLDIMNFWQKVARMAGLPVALTQGYNKKMRLNLIQPLSLGMDGLNEFLHITMDEEMDSAEMIKQIERKQQDKMILKKLVPVKYTAKWFSKHRASAVYKVKLGEGSVIAEFLAEFADKIISSVELGNNEYKIKLINTAQTQVNIFKLFSQIPKIAILDVKRLRLEYRG